MGKGKAKYEAAMRFRDKASQRARLERVMKARGETDMSELLREAMDLQLTKEEKRLKLPPMDAAPPPNGVERE